jgi:peptide/nickel transport system substrate-binding protein
MRRLAPLAAVLIALSCKVGERAASIGPDSSSTGGTVVISTGGDPDVLFPPLVATIQGRQVSEIIYDHLADLGNDLNTVGDAGFTPHLAKSWTWSLDSLSITFSLDPRARWHDGVPARASDVAFTYALYKDSATASPSAPLISGIDSVTARDSLTAVFWFSKRSPMQFFEAVNPMVVLPKHLLRGSKGAALRTSALARSPVGTGRFRFESWKAGSSISLAADTGNYKGRPRIDRVMWSIAPDFNTAFTRLLGGESDVLEQLAAPNVAELVGNNQLRTVLLPGMEYNFLQFNLHDPANASRPHPLFADRGLRRALTMAIDRVHTVQNVYDTLAAVALGPTVRAYASTDTTLRQIPYSPDGARHLLDSLGWRVAAGDSLRVRNGRRLAFVVSVPSSSRNRMNMAVLIQNQLRQVGVIMDIDRIDFPSFVDRESHHAFDAAIGSWNVDASPGGIRQTWGSARAKATGGSNYGSYSNPAFDAAVDSAMSAMSLGDRRARFRRAYQIIIDDAPAIWLAEPRSVMGISRRIRTPLLRPDAWWSSIADWWVPPSERIARDRVGLKR